MNDENMQHSQQVWLQTVRMLVFRKEQEAFGSEFSYWRTVGCSLILCDIGELELRQQLVEIFEDN